MLSFRNLISIALIGGLVSTAAAQTTMSLNWKVRADDVASTYILSSGDATRGMALNPNLATGGSLLVASRANGNLVRRVDPATGILRDPAVLTPGYASSGQTFVINKVVATSDGIIYVGNLALSSTSAATYYRLYRYADEFSAPTVAAEMRVDNFPGDGGPGANTRLGDDLAITGTGNDTKILVAGAAAGGLAVFTTADNGLTFTGSLVNATPATPASTPHIAWDPTVANRFYYRNAGGDVAIAYNLAGTVATQVTGVGIDLPSAAATPAYSPFDVGTFNGVHSAAFGIGNSAEFTKGKPVLVFSMSDLSVTYQGFGTEYDGTGSKKNGNASGDVVIDSVTNSIYVLFTNNSVTKFTLPASVKDWSVY